MRFSTTWRSLIGALVLCIGIFIVYLPALHGDFLWDDDRYVTHNFLLTASDGLKRIWFSMDAPSQYFPLTYTFLRIQHSFWGLNPAGYHAVNIILHALNALLVWAVLSRLRIPGTWLAAAIFALHPVQVESVAWISELKNLLMAFFFLLSLLFWSFYLDASAKERRRMFYVLALLCGLLALFAKSTACTLPAALLLTSWLKERPIGRRSLLEITPFVIAALGVGLLAVWWEKYHQGTRVLVALGPIERILVASRAMWFYLSKLFWPAHLSFIYPKWNINAADPRAYLALLAIAISSAALYFGRKFIGRSAIASLLFFVATLAPLLGFFMLYTFRYTFVADHYQYLACIGPIALGSAGVVYLRDKVNAALGFGIGLLVLCALGSLSWLQSATYRDAETLWRATLSKNPACWMAYNNLGVLEFQQGKTESAIANYEHALGLNPNYPEAHYNLATALLQIGQADAALDECERALRLQPNDPDAHIVLGNAYMARNDANRAIESYEKALALRPDDSDAHYNLAAALTAKGDTARAAIEFEKARRFQANDSH